MFRTNENNRTGRSRSYVAISQASSRIAPNRLAVLFPGHDVAVNNPTRWPGNSLLLSLIATRRPEL